jgi:uncharacterized membrane protein
MLQTHTTTTRVTGVRAASPGLPPSPRERRLQLQARPSHRLAKGLGWFSIALGLSQLIAPRGLARGIGVRENPRSIIGMLAVGLRELTAGVGILASRSRKARMPWLWARVGGDIMDIALLGKALNDRRKRREDMQLIGALTAVVGVTALDLLSAGLLSRRTDEDVTSRVRRQKQVGTNTITINVPPEEVYRFWRDFENLPRFMRHLASVTTIDEKRSRWVVKGPADLRVEWIAEIIADRVNEAIIWRSVQGADVDNSGSVQFLRAPGGRGTEVWVEIAYNAPGGRLGAAVAKLFGKEPSQQVQGELRRLKQLLETGEVVHSDASIHRGLHPARPTRSRINPMRLQKEVIR